jgi:hypothetical protein
VREPLILLLVFAKIASALKTLKFLSGGGSLSLHDGNPVLFDCLGVAKR